jgi:hypothetical protein
MCPTKRTFGVRGLHSKEKEEDPFTKEELPADDKALAKYECEKESSVPGMPQQEELPADDGVLTKYEYSHRMNVMTSQGETLDVAKMFAYMNENYNIPNQMRDDDKPTAEMEREEPNVRETPYNIDETYQEEDVANHEQTNGVANKKKSRDLP